MTRPSIRAHGLLLLHFLLVAGLALLVPACRRSDDTAVPAPGATQPATVVPADPCALVTRAEAEAALGRTLDQPVARTPTVCNYVRLPDDVGTGLARSQASVLRDATSRAVSVIVTTPPPGSGIDQLYERSRTAGATDVGGLGERAYCAGPDQPGKIGVVVRGRLLEVVTADCAASEKLARIAVARL